jgi:hypothetical protein
MNSTLSVRGAKSFGVLLALAFAGAAHGGAPVKEEAEVDLTDQSTRWSDLCGFEVDYVVSGKLRVSFQPGSNVAHEVDTFPGFKQVLVAPSTGGSFTQILGPTRVEYPDGVFIGAYARVTFLGKGYSTPGYSEAGRYVYAGQVFLILDGVPLVDWTDPISSSGHDPLHDDTEAYYAAGSEGRLANAGRSQGEINQVHL